MKKLHWNKRTILLGTAAVAVTAFIGGQTLAYFTDSQSVANTFTVGNLDIEEKETDWDDKVDGKDLYPGTILYKNPTVRNKTSNANGDEPCYVRMIVEAVDKDNKPIQDTSVTDLIWKTIYYDRTYTGTSTAKGEATNLKEGKTGGYTLAELSRSYSMVSDAFVKDEKVSTANRYVFNYVKDEGLLKSGQEAVLFSNIVIPSHWNQTQMNKLGNYNLNISAEAIQARGFSSQTEAFEALDREKAGNTMQKIG